MSSDGKPSPFSQSSRGPVQLHPAGVYCVCCSMTSTRPLLGTAEEEQFILVLSPALIGDYPLGDINWDATDGSKLRTGTL